MQTHGLVITGLGKGCIKRIFLLKPLISNPQVSCTTPLDSSDLSPALADFIASVPSGFGDRPIQPSTPADLMSGEAPTADEVRLHRSSRLRKATPVFDPTDDTRPNRMVATRQPASTPSSQPPPNLSQKEVAVSSQSSTGPPKTGKGSRSALPGDWDLFTDPHTGDTRRLVAVAWVHRSSAQEASRFGEVLMGDGVQCTNAQRRPLYDILTVGPNGKNIIVLEVLLLNLKMSLYSWMFWDALPSLMGTEFCQRVRLILTDGDIWQVKYSYQ